jgi:hypothetical protein
MYASALPAGSFRGIGSVYVAREGLSASYAARNRVLGSTGIAGLGGDPNLCTDPGWQIAQRITTAAGGIIAGAAGDDRGWATAGNTVSAVGDVWAATCMAEVRGSTDGATTPRESVEDVYARARAEMERDAATARAADLDLRLREAALTSQPASSGVSQQTLLIAGGVAVAALAAFFLLRR